MFRTVHSTTKLGRRYLGEVRRTTGRGKVATYGKTAPKRPEQPAKESGTPFANSIVFQLFLIVGAMGAGYSLGKSVIEENTPAGLFPLGSTTKLKDLEGQKTKAYGDYDKFRRCILRILQGQGYDVDVKNNQNDKLYEDPFMSKDVAEVMNEVDKLQDVFLGRTLDETKTWTFYPENTEQVSAILATCNEFKIPVFTTEDGYNVCGNYKFLLDLSRINTIKFGSGTVEVGPGTDCSLLYSKLKESGQVINDTDALRIVLASLGIRLNSSDQVCGKYDRSQIQNVTAVLPDGTTLTVGQTTPIERQLFDLVVDTGVITAVKMTPQQSDQVIGIVEADTLAQVNDTVKRITKRIPLDVTFVNGINCRPLQKAYGHDTLAVMKMPRSDAKRYNLKVFELTDLPPVAPTLYYSSQVKGDTSSALIVSTGNEVTSFVETTQIAETRAANETEQLDLYRKVHMAVDPGQILDPNLKVLTKVSKD